MASQQIHHTAENPIDILFVDSVRLFHQIITQIFSGTRLRPNFAESAAAAIKRVDESDFAIVCAALHLPDMTGIELCRGLRQMPKGRVTPFILLTASAPQAFIVEAYAAGVTDVFEKQALEPLVTMLQRLLVHREPAEGRVLVVEDTSAQAAFFVGVLSAIGLVCDVVKSAEAALEKIAGCDYDLIVMDLMLAGCMSGVTLANQIRRLPSAKGEVPILAATAFDDLSRRIELFHLGIDDYIIKPVVAEELTARARNLIGHYRLLQQARGERRQAEAERADAIRALAHRASHDALTGLANRWVFEERLAALLGSETAAKTGLALLDVGALRIVNDACGHAAGDALMQEVGRRAAAAEVSLIARHEGARIGVLVEAATSGERGSKLVSLLATFEAQPFVWGERNFSLRLVGGALLSLAGLGSVTEVLTRAETAIAAAHAGGVSGMLFYDASDERIAAREREKSTLPDLLSALDHGHIVLFTQRIAPLSEQDSSGLGCEFLCRMIAPDGALVMPGNFLPAAERYGLMPRVDRLVTALAFDWLAARYRQSAGGSDAHDFFTINLSGQTIGDLDFVKFVREKLAESGAPADRIYFEITETAVVADPDAAIEFMALISQLGCRFALDDFGSGTASYGQLKRMPVHLIKIDGQFVVNIETNLLDQAIVRSTCEVARALGLPVVAEFVENDAQLAILKEIGVDFVQGYAIDRPAPA